jgi:flagellin
MSVLRIYSNPIALNADRNLNMTGSAISQSLARLSSGLAINSAADNAAGLSISEKLRGQIRGLNQASANAQDGISLIQTAEGALNETTSILQRMRELAVQAANGTYTADDRQAIQQEVSQLVDEINRISNTTEFNTKKLLDGTLNALVSTDDYSKVQAAVVGQVGKGGNFVLRAVAKNAGQLQVQKTDVFATTQNTDAAGQLNYLNTLRGTATIKTANTQGIGNTGVYQIEVPNGANGSIAVNSNVDGLLRFSGASLAGAGLSYGRSLQSDELTTGDKFLFTVRTSGSTVSTMSFALPSFGTTFTSFAALLSNAINGALGANTATVGFNGTGQLSVGAGTGVTSVSILNSKFVDVDGSGSNFYLSFGANGTGSASNAFYSAVQYSFFNNGGATSGKLQHAAAQAQGQFFSIGTAATGAINVRVETNFNYHNVSLAGATLSDSIGWSRYGGGNSLQDGGRVFQTGAATTNGTFLVSAISNRAYAVFQFNNDIYTSLVGGGTNQSIAQLAARGSRMTVSTGASNGVFSLDRMFIGSVGSALENVNIAFSAPLQAGESATFNLSTNNVLTGDQLNTLGSLNRFQDFGVFNGANTVTLTLYQRGSNKSVQVLLNKNDTLEDAAGKISLALWDPNGNGVFNTGIINPQQTPDLVHVNTIGNAKGTVSITTPVPGAELVFAGSEALLNALSLIQVKQGISPTYSINAYNIERNATVGSVTTSTNEINGLLPGLKLFFDNTIGINLDPQPPTGNSNTVNNFAYTQPTASPALSLSGQVATVFIHVAPRDFSLQIGANQGQTLSTFIGAMSAQALGVSGLVVVSSDLAQEAISKIDTAINKVSSQRSQLGAVQNRLQSTINNLNVASQNLTSSEARIRDVDVAAETINSTRNQILLQAGVAALAQANALPQTVLQLLR